MSPSLAINIYSLNEVHRKDTKEWAITVRWLDRIIYHGHCANETAAIAAKEAVETSFSGFFYLTGIKP